MSAMASRWIRSRRNQCLLFVIFLLCLLYYAFFGREEKLDLELTKRASIINYIKRGLEEALKLEKGKGCDIPKMDPFDKEVTQFEKDMPPVVCEGLDWVTCHHSTCRVRQEILETTKNVVCVYQDIIYETDYKSHLGPSVKVYDNNVHVLVKSDHVKVSCTGKKISNQVEILSIFPSLWSGYVVGFRRGGGAAAGGVNVLVLGFDSTSRNGFIRRMPLSYKVLKEDLKAVVLEGYNIVGDGTPASLFPLLTGKTELELPDIRKSTGSKGTCDIMPFIFYKLKAAGYRTAYFEDMPWIGTFQYRFNGWKNQPADHYLRAFYQHESDNGKKWYNSKTKYCVGDKPQYAMMLNLTEQFFEFDGNKFCFTFIADITHDDFNMISTADEKFAQFLRQLKKKGVLDNTILFVMGDHGPRYAKVRSTYRGKLEERLPLMAVVLPKALKDRRPAIEKALRANAEVLTTPHDIHATLLDALDMRQYWVSDKIEGSDLKRGLTLFEPIPSSRSCPEAGIEAHWCSCARWDNVTDTKEINMVAKAVVDFINKLTEGQRQKCAIRTLTSIDYVWRRGANKNLLRFASNKDADGYVGKFNANTKIVRQDYSAKLILGPGNGVYETTLIYDSETKRFEMNIHSISRINAYGHEPDCISETHPHLNSFCYCND